MDSNHRYPGINYRFETDFYRLRGRFRFPNGIYFFRDRELEESAANRHGAIKRRDPASLPIYFTSSIEWTILEARP